MGNGAVVVSGASSVLGRTVVTRLANDGRQVIGIDLTSSMPPVGQVAYFGETDLADAVRRLSTGGLEVYAENIPEGLQPELVKKLYQGQLPMLRGTGCKDVTAYAFGAQFVEVRIHRLTREIRVPRMVGAFAAGTIINPPTAYSQYMGGMIWGLGAALEEKTEIDLRHARYVNDDIVEYHVPVNANVAKVDVIMVPERDDRVNPLGHRQLMYRSQARLAPHTIGC